MKGFNNLPKSVPRLGALFIIILTASILPIVSTHISTPTAQAACDPTKFSQTEATFQQMVQQRAVNPNAISDDAYRAAALAYIEGAELCYHANVDQSPPEPVLIDEGGVWFPGFEPSGDDLSPQYVTFGNKWGNSTFGTPGGTVTYSYMPPGVSHAVEGRDSNTQINDLLGFSSCFYTEIDTAFAAWAAVANIDFVEVTDSGDPSNWPGAVGDIRIGAHNFDGSGGTLAHTYYPPPNGWSIAGDMHFDDDETWSCTTSGGYDIGIVTLHELGHAFGLMHETSVSAVMNPYYDRFTNGLLQDDINGIVAIYGIPPKPSVGHSTDPNPILASTSEILYTLTIRSNRNTTITDVKITNIIPAGTSYIFGSASDGGYTIWPGNIIEWSNITMNGDTLYRTFRISVTGTITDGDILTNTLSVTSNQDIINIEDKILMNIVNPTLTYLPLIFK